MTPEYATLLAQGYVVAPITGMFEADDWRNDLRAAARADRLAFRSLANADGVVAWLPDHAAFARSVPC